MDLALYAQVLWKHRVLVLVGVIVALVLSTLSYYRLDTSGVLPSLTPRQSEVWQSLATVALTASDGQVVPVPGVNQPERFSSVVGLYARLATSDPVMQRLRADREPIGSFTAAAQLDANRAPLPIVLLSGTGRSPEVAERTVSRGLQAFLAFVAQQQAAADVPRSSRVRLRVVNAPQPATLTLPRKRTLPIAVFLAVVMSAIALAFIVENAGRRVVATATNLRPALQTEDGPRRTEDTAEELRPESVEDEPEETVSVRRWA